MAKRNPWKPHVLSPKSFRVDRFDSSALEVEALYSPTNPASPEMAAELRGRWVFSFLPDRVKVAYALSQNCRREVFETGVALSLSSGASRFDWVGLGPYEAYPGSSLLSDFGVWSLDSRDLYFPGNRREVRALRVLADGDAGLVVLPGGGSGDFAFERKPGGGVLLGANAVVSCRACRFMVPPDVRTVEAGEELRGEFAIAPATAFPASALSAVFGDTPAPVPFAPFLKVYDD